MLELMYGIYFLGLLAVTCTIFLFLRDNSSYSHIDKHKFKNLLLYGYLKTCITWEYGKHYIDIGLKSIFTSYPAGNKHMKEIDKRKQQLMHIQHEMKTPENVSRSISGYNLKILK